MSAYSYDVTTAEFKELVIDTSMNVPVVVDFWAEWCEPCKVLKPLLEKLADEYKGRFILAKVDADANPELTGHFGIRSLPTVAAFVDGQPVDGFAGAKTEGQIREFLERFVPPAGPESEEPASPFDVARATREAGDKAEGRRLLEAALADEPDNKDGNLYLAELCIEDGELDEAEKILAQLSGKGGHDARIDALRARIALARRNVTADADIAGLEARVNAEPDNHQLRLELADTLIAAQNYRGALEHLLISVKKDRQWNEAAARKSMLTLFDLLAADENHIGLVREFRTALARTLN